MSPKNKDPDFSGSLETPPIQSDDPVTQYKLDYQERESAAAWKNADALQRAVKVMQSQTEKKDKLHEKLLQVMEERFKEKLTVLEEKLTVLANEHKDALDAQRAQAEEEKVAALAKQKAKYEEKIRYYQGSCSYDWFGVPIKNNQRGASSFLLHRVSFAIYFSLVLFVALAGPEDPAGVKL